MENLYSEKNKDNRHEKEEQDYIHTFHQYISMDYIHGKIHGSCCSNKRIKGNMLKTIHYLA